MFSELALWSLVGLHTSCPCPCGSSKKMLAGPLRQNFCCVFVRWFLMLAVCNEIWPIHCSCSVRPGEAFGNALPENVNLPRVAVLIFLWHHIVPKNYLEGCTLLPEELRVHKLEGKGRLWASLVTTRRLWQGSCPSGD